MIYLRFVAVLCLAVVLATGAYAGDMTYGSGARSAAMGGAGLALTDSPTSASVTNPASSAALGQKLQFVFPGIDLHSEGASVSDLQNRLSEIGDSSVDEAIGLAEDFGKERTTLTASLTTGITGRLGITLEGEVQAIINPGDAFKDWVNAGAPVEADDLVAAGLVADTNLATLQAYADTFTDGTYVGGKLVYALPAVTFGSGFNTKNGQLWVGTKMKWLRSEVRNWNITATAVDSGGNLGTRAVALPPGEAGINLDAVEQPAIEDDGLAADLGFIFKPNNSIIQYGMVINNFIKPNLGGVETPVMLSVGAAAQVRPGIVVAADLVNINKAYNEKTRLRMGAEWQVTKKFAIRAGHSGTDFTCGFRAFGVDFAFSGDAPQMISKTLRY